MSNRTNFIRRFVCWILPLLVVLLIGLYLVLAPIVSTYAAAPSTPHHVVAPEVQPDMLWPLQ
jgi:hypothetical protein